MSHVLWSGASLTVPDQVNGSGWTGSALTTGTAGPGLSIVTLSGDPAYAYTPFQTSNADTTTLRNSGFRFSAGPAAGVSWQPGKLTFRNRYSLTGATPTPQISVAVYLGARLYQGFQSTSGAYETITVDLTPLGTITGPVTLLIWGSSPSSSNFTYIDDIRVESYVAPVVGTPGPSAYDVAVSNGFVGTQTQWLASLVGATGSQGPQGVAGPTGATGATGATGPKGDTGDVGPAGPQGIQGVAGPAGPAGADGADGPPGADGAAGPQGVAGPQGLPGVAGPAGPPGADGAAGPAPTDDQIASAVAAYLMLHPPIAPEVVGAPTGLEVAEFIGQEDQPAVIEMCGQASTIVTRLARRYTRGNGFYAEGLEPELASVIVAASARLAANPEQISSQVGGLGVYSGFKGWTLAEQRVLNELRGVAK